MNARFFPDGGLSEYMTDPVVDATSVYVGRNVAAGTVTPAASYVTALPADPDPQEFNATWQVTVPAGISADLAYGASTLFVPTGGTIIALSTADGSATWSHELSGSAVKGARW